LAAYAVGQFIWGVAGDRVGHDCGRRGRVEPGDCDGVAARDPRLVPVVGVGAFDEEHWRVFFTAGMGSRDGLLVHKLCARWIYCGRAGRLGSRAVRQLAVCIWGACGCARCGVAVLLFFFNDLPENRLAIGLGFFGIGFLLYIPDSLISGTAAIDFGTKKGASTAAGLINGCGSIGAIVGGTLPGLLEEGLGQGAYIWDYVFTGLAISLLTAALLLLPRWNAMPP